jgi:hypothetical protein
VRGGVVGIMLIILPERISRPPSFTERRKTSIESLRRESADDVERGAAVADAAASPR